jgi:hypothetical protein
MARVFQQERARILCLDEEGHPSQVIVTARARIGSDDSSQPGAMTIHYSIDDGIRRLSVFPLSDEDAYLVTATGAILRPMYGLGLHSPLRSDSSAASDSLSGGGQPEGSALAVAGAGGADTTARRGLSSPHRS